MVGVRGLRGAGTEKLKGGECVCGGVGAKGHEGPQALAALRVIRYLRAVAAQHTPLMPH